MICDTILCSKFSLLQRYLFAFKKAIKIKLAVGNTRREHMKKNAGAKMKSFQLLIPKHIKGYYFVKYFMFNGKYK